MMTLNRTFMTLNRTFRPFVAVILLAFATPAIGQSNAQENAATIVERLAVGEHRDSYRPMVERILLVAYEDVIEDLGGTIADPQQFLDMVPEDTITAAETALFQYQIQSLTRTLSADDLAQYVQYLNDNLAPLNDPTAHAGMPGHIDAVAQSASLSIWVGIPVFIENGQVGMEVDLETPELLEIILSFGIVRFSNPIARRQAAEAVRESSG